MRARALEAAREEIKELREAQMSAKDELEKVVEGRKEIEQKLENEKTEIGDKLEAV